MINRDMRNYEFFTLGAKDEYGQEVISENTQGSIKIAIYTLSNTIGTNINYKDSTYIALTTDKNINDNYVIKYGDKKLKVLYIIPSGRLTEVFLSEM